MAVGGAYAVGAGVAAADHDHMLAGGHDLICNRVAGDNPVLLRQEFHREMHALQFAARHRQIARNLGAAREHHGVEVGQQFFRWNVSAHFLAHAELHAFSLHLLDAAIDEMLFHLEVGNAIAQQAADAIIFLKQHHVMPRARELLRARHACRAGADDRHALAGFLLRRLRRNPAIFPAFVDDRVLDRFDAHRVGVDAQRAGFFARRWDKRGP